MDHPNFYSILTADVRYDTGISDFAKVLYSEITALCNKRGYCSAQNAYFMTRFAKSRRTITATIEALADAGYLYVEVARDDKNAVIDRKIWVNANAREALGKVPSMGAENCTTPHAENCTTPHAENCQYIRINNTSNNNTPIPPEGTDGLFDQFWSVYPKRVAKKAARRAWDKLHADEALLDKMLAALEWQTKLDSWTREGGRYIPNPATWLNAARWEDEQEAAKPEKPKATVGGELKWLI